MPFFIVAPALGALWCLALMGAASLFLFETPDTRFLIRPSLPFWMIPSLFLGMISSAIPLDRLYRVLLRDRYSRFDLCCTQRVGFDGNRMLALFAALIVPGAAVFFVIGVTQFARFSDAGVEIGRALSFRTTFYGYDRIRAIEHRATFPLPEGDRLDQPHYVILFDNGTTWSTRDGHRDLEPERDGRIMQFVSHRIGRPIAERP